MKVNCVIEDDIHAYSHFAERSIRMYLYDLVCGFECACTLVSNKVGFVCARVRIFYRQNQISVVDKTLKIKQLETQLDISSVIAHYIIIFIRVSTVHCTALHCKSISGKKI
jgi:hypothetical protein